MKCVNGVALILGFNLKYLTNLKSGVNYSLLKCKKKMESDMRHSDLVFSGFPLSSGFWNVHTHDRVDK